MSVPFRQDAFGGSSVLEVSIAWNADTVGDPTGIGWTWTDETAKVHFAAKVKITQGRADETSQAAPCNINFSLLNDLNAYSAYNPMSTNAQQGARNTPVRVRVNLGAGAVVLAQGYIIGLKPTWDITGKLSIVQVAAAGILRRLSQGKTPLRSPLYRANMRNGSTLVAYWPMEEGQNATACAPATANTQPLSRTGGGTVKFGTSVDAGAAAMPDFTGRGQLTAPIPNYAGTSFSVNYTMGWTDAVQIDQVLMVATSSGLRFYFRFYPTLAGGNTFVYYYSAATGLTGFTSATTATAWPDPTKRYTVAFSFRQNGGNVDIWMRLENVTEFLAATLTGETLGTARTVTVNPGDFDGTVVQSAFTFGHLAINAPAPHPMTITANLAGASVGYAGELADARMIRLCAEENVPLTVNGTSTQAMGPQGIASLVDLLLETAKADGGPLFDGFGPGLTFNTLSSRYNIAASLTTDVPSGQLAPPFDPTDDDQRTVNDFTASRGNGGGSVRVFDTTSALSTLRIGIYDSSDSFNVYDDTSLAPIAGWRVRLGTVAGLRYPAASWEFAITSPTLAATYLARALPIGWRSDITNVTTSAPSHPPGTVSQIVEGLTTVIDPFTWSVVANCSPYAPWSNVGTVDDATIVCGSEDTTVHAGGITINGLSLVCDVVTAWSTTGADYPIDLNLGGERVTCSGVSGAGPTQTFTLTARALNGVAKAHVAGESVDAWSSAVAAL